MTERTGRLEETLAVLDVGHGASAVLFSGNDVAVFDTGTGSSLLEFLDQQGVTRIRTVVLSHADRDHIGGLVGLLAANTVAIGRVVANTDSSQGSPRGTICSTSSMRGAGPERSSSTTRSARATARPSET